METNKEVRRNAEEERGLYIISVAAKLLDMHPQTLRKYERMGLINPPRTMGMLRLYSAEDIARLRLIKYLVDDRGMNLAGVEMALTLISSVLQMRQILALTQDFENMRSRMQGEIEEILAAFGFPWPSEINHL